MMGFLYPLRLDRNDALEPDMALICFKGAKILSQPLRRFLQ